MTSSFAGEVHTSVSFPCSFIVAPEVKLCPAIAMEEMLIFVIPFPISHHSDAAPVVLVAFFLEISWRLEAGYPEASELAVIVYLSNSLSQMIRVTSLLLRSYVLAAFRPRLPWK